jgi:GNAT superfamily N-acetyltransferase
MANSVPAIHIASRSAPEIEAARAELVQLLRESVDGGASIGFLAPMPEADAVRFWRGVEAQVETGSRVLLVARDGPRGRIVGTGQLAFAGFPNGRHRAEVCKVMVLPSHRRRGIGTSLMTALERRALERDVWLLHLDTTEGRSGACELYEALGYTRVGGIPDWARDPDGTLKTTVVYFKKLS